MDSPALTKEEKQAAKKKRLAAARKAGKKKGRARRVVQQIFAEILWGELGMRVMIWKTEMKSQFEEAVSEALDDDLAAALDGAAQDTEALQKAAAVGAAEGSVATDEPYITPPASLSPEAAKKQRLAAARKAGKKKGRARRVVQQIFAQMLCGELGMRVMIWKTEAGLGAAGDAAADEAVLAKLAAEGEGAVDRAAEGPTKSPMSPQTEERIYAARAAAEAGAAQILQAAFDAAGVTQQARAGEKLATMTTAAAAAKQPILAEAHSAILGQNPQKFPKCLCPNSDCAYNVAVRMLGGTTTS